MIVPYIPDLWVWKYELHKEEKPSELENYWESIYMIIFFLLRRLLPRCKLEWFLKFNNLFFACY